MTSTPASAAARTTSAGGSWPSEMVEWDWRSMVGIYGPWEILDSDCDNSHMRITAKADYAVRAALELAAAPEGEPVKGERLAEAQEIPLRFLEHILLELKHARLVKARRGAKGGY